MKIPPKKPHFFKPIQPGFKHGLKIPIGFLKYLKGQEHIEHAILRKAGKKWLVKVKYWRFEAGWAEFVQQHDLQLGDLLIFRHEGDMEFEVSIFDSRHCDREYAEYLQEEGGNNVEETSRNFEFKGKSNLCIMSSSKAFPHAEAGIHSPCGESHFECTVRPYCISNGYLRLPKQFATKNGLINKKCGVIIKDERPRSWNLRLATHNSIVHVLGEWAEFCVVNDLKEGDYMMFEVIANGEKPIWKFHNQPNPNIVSSRKAFCKEESATHSSFGESHFLCTVRPYCLSKNFLWLPKQFAQANGLVNKKCGLVIRDERQRSWNLRLDNYGYRVYIAEGWRKFCVDNGLKEGDCITFEVVTNGEKSIWKFHDLRHKTSDVTAPISQIPASTSTDANPHFISSIKPYALRNSTLYLPMDFVKSNGLMSRSEMILVDEKQRSWSVWLGRTERHFGIRRGWTQFRKANGVLVGDTYKFELTNNGTMPIVHYLRHKTSDVAAPISQIPASTSTDANPHFISTIKPYAFTNSALYLPMDFVKSNGLMSRSEMILVDEKQRSWLVWLGRKERHFGIRRGWTQFRKANGVQVGDTYKFELTNNGTIPIVHCKFCSILGGNDTTQEMVL